MKFMVTWATKPPQQREATARFLQTGGGPPAGVKMLGRWHAPGRGFVLAESTDVKSLYEWIMQWSDLLEFDITPVMEDADAGEVMKKVTK